VDADVLKVFFCLTTPSFFALRFSAHITWLVCCYSALTMSQLMQCISIIIG
jgi:hypothetical protein